MYPRNQVTVRSSETGRVFRINRKVAERHDTLTVLGDEETAEAEYGERSYNDLRALISDRNADREEGDRIQSAGTKADLIAALVADDNQ